MDSVISSNAILCAGYILLLSSSMLVGILIGKKAPSKWKYGAFAGLFVLFFSVILQVFLPEYEIQYITWPDYVFFRDWYFVGAFIVFGIGITKIDPGTRRSLFIFVMFIIFLKAGLWWQKLYNLDFKFTERGTVDGVCRQSTGYTCVPACCVTLMTSIGIAASEIEMAELCLTMQASGTADIEAVRGLRLKLAGTGRRVRISRCTWNEFLKIPKPCLVSVKLAENLNHMITVSGVSGEIVEVGDPLIGKTALLKDDFQEKWFERAIWVE